MPDSDISSKEPNDQFNIGYVFMVGGFLVFLVFVVLLFCVCRDIRRCLFSLCGLCKEQCNGTHIQNQSDHQQRNAKQDQLMDSSALSTPVMDSIAPSAPRLEPVNLPPSYEEAVKMTDNITQSLNPKLLWTPE